MKLKRSDAMLRRQVRGGCFLYVQAYGQFMYEGAQSRVPNRSMSRWRGVRLARRSPCEK